MKKAFFLYALITMFIAGTIFTSCQSSTEKVDAAKSNVEDAKQDLTAEQRNANSEAQETANTKAWEAFKLETDVQIKVNEIRIAELSEKAKKTSKAVDAKYAKSVAELEQKNTELKNRMDTYVLGKSDWELFKTEFNHDMEGLGQALKDLTVDNKN